MARKIIPQRTFVLLCNPYVCINKKILYPYIITIVTIFSELINVCILCTTMYSAILKLFKSLFIAYKGIDYFLAQPLMARSH